MFEDHKVHVFIGMFGSGKTEVALNLALKLKENNEKVAIADVDTISPYFRTRDEKSNLESKGIEVITPPVKYMYADVPIISPRIGGYINNPEFKTVLDVGGNDDGAIVLGSLNNFIKKADVATYFVVNTKRPFTDTKEKIVEHIKRLSVKARVNVDYIVANPNVMDDTTQEIVDEGEKILSSVSEEMGIPIVFTAIDEGISERINTKYPKFLINRFMNKIWD